MDDAKNQLADKLKTAANILVTVSRNPSVDQLAACIGLTLLLNKQGKHAAAVFSGTVPSTLEFLQPEDTLEKTTDSLRDFIISLDKSKADKLRYKVEDNVVRIFITPYRTSISEADLEFTQGDFNVDLVVALGVHLQEDLDQAITAHGRILHDATLTSINTSAEGGLGTINWYDQRASSLCELVTELAQKMDSKLLDNQISTALLTGIVAETDRFSNDKTSSETMAASAALMAAGANQQLVASKLQEGLDISASIQGQTDQSAGGAAGAGSSGQTGSADGAGDGVIEINHHDEDVNEDAEGDVALPPFELPTPQAEPSVDEQPPDEGSADILTDGPAGPAGPAEPDGPTEPPPPITGSGNITAGSKLVTEPPSLGGMLTANTKAEGLDPATDPLSLPSNAPPQMFDRKQTTTLPSTPAASEGDQAQTPDDVSKPVQAAPQPNFTAPPSAWVPPAPVSPPPPMSVPAPPTPEPADHTLADLEASLGSPHATPASGSTPADDSDSAAPAASDTTSGVTHLDAARDEVNRALSDSHGPPPAPEPIQALNAQPLGVDLHPDDKPAESSAPPAIPPLEISEDGTLTQMSEGSGVANPTVGPDPSPVIDSTAPPPVPPPIPFQFGSNPPPPQ